MIFKMVSKEVRRSEYSNSLDNFTAKDGFLYYRGVKIGKCRYTSIFSNNKLIIEKDNIIETYELQIRTDLTKYDIHEGLLRVFDDEDNLLKIYTFDRIREINDGIILQGNRTILLKSYNEEVEMNSSFELSEAVVGCLPGVYTLHVKRSVSYVPSSYNIDLKNNILHPEIIILDNLYSVKDQQQEIKNHLFSQLDKEDGFLVIKSTEEVVYNRTGCLILFLNGVYLCRDLLPIKSIIMTSCFNIKDKILIVAITTTHIFMIYDKLISYKYHSEIIYRISSDQDENLIPVVYTLNGTIPLHDLYLTLTLFSDLPIGDEGLQSFLFDLFIFTDLADKLIGKIFDESNLEIETVLCNIYRLVDDKCKRIIDKYILVRPLEDISNLKKIIIFHPEYIPEYIKRCIKEQKEYEIEVLIEHYKDTQFIKTIAYELLRFNCFYLFTQCHPEYERYFDEAEFDKSILKVEKYNSMSQKNRHK